MRRFALLLMSIVVFVGLTACSKAEKVLDQAAISKELKSKGTLELMKEAAEDQYEPPADGRLSEQQIQMYMKVRDQEKLIVQTAKKEAEAHAKKAEKNEKSLAGIMAGLKTLGSVADMFTADVRAAKDLGVNTAEYQWIKEKVLEASGADFADKASQSFSAILDSQVEALKKQIAETSDETTRKFLEESLAAAEKPKAEMTASAQEQDPAIAYNKQLLSKYENALNALAHEFSKFGDEAKKTQ